LQYNLGKTSKKKKGGLYYLVSDDDDDDDDDNGVFGSFSFFLANPKKKLTLLFGCVYEFEKKKGGFFFVFKCYFRCILLGPIVGCHPQETTNNQVGRG